jgi:hypothetical protein
LANAQIFTVRIVFGDISLGFGMQGTLKCKASFTSLSRKLFTASLFGESRGTAGSFLTATLSAALFPIVP